MKTKNFLILFCSGYSLTILCMETAQPHNNKHVRKAISQQIFTRRPRIYTPEGTPAKQQFDNSTDNSQVYMEMLEQWSEDCKKQKLKRSQSK